LYVVKNPVYIYIAIYTIQYIAINTTIYIAMHTVMYIAIYIPIYITINIAKYNHIHYNMHCNNPIIYVATYIVKYRELEMHVKPWIDAN